MSTFCEVKALPSVTSTYNDATVCVDKMKGGDVILTVLMSQPCRATPNTDKTYRNLSVSLEAVELDYLIAALINARDNRFEKSM